MAVKIRLKRLGAKKNPQYRIIAIDSRKRRDGKEIEILGYYDPKNDSNTKLDKEAIQAWIKKGAIPTPTVKGLINKV